MCVCIYQVSRYPKLARMSTLVLRWRFSIKYCYLNQHLNKAGCCFFSFRFGHHRSRSLSPDHRYLRTTSPAHHTDVLVSSSLPASPQITAQNKSHQTELECKPVRSDQSSKPTSQISEKAVLDSDGSNNHNANVKREEGLNNNITTSKFHRSSDVKARRKSLHDMRQSSCNVLLINETEVGHCV